ncbi:MAG: DUF2892 domain-containing protein [Bacteroidetes bacterium]|nr:DUF2892 domain-containing protein [Bacteroidota bacterium]
MKNNVGAIDKTIRLIIAAIAAILIITGVLTGLLAIIFGIIGAVMLITSFMGFCGLYAIFGFNTCKIEEEK